MSRHTTSFVISAAAALFLSVSAMAAVYLLATSFQQWASDASP